MTFGETFTTKEVSQFVPLHCIAAVVTVVVLYWMHRLASMPTNSKLLYLKFANIITKVMNLGKCCSTVYHSELGYSPFFPVIYSCEAVSYS